MASNDIEKKIIELRQKYPFKFLSEDKIFSHIHPGQRIFIGTACGEPQYLVNALIKYVQSHPKALYDAEILHVWTLGVAPYADPKFKDYFRHNSFFIGNNTRQAVNRGVADYTPIFLSQVPDLFYKKMVPIDVALIQTSMPDEHGYLSLGISVDIVKAAVDVAALVIAQINPAMPRVHGEAFVNINKVDFIVPYNEPLLEFSLGAPDDIVEKIGTYVSRLIEDGDTIQVGYAAIPNAILGHLKNKKNLGIHTELLTDGIVELMKQGVIDNSKKELNKGKTVASFCMGKKATYEYLHDNPSIEFRPVNYTNNPLVIARHRNMTAINSALEIDLTGQSTAESLGTMFYSGIGGQADFMRGAVLSQGGKTILAMQSTAENGELSKIVPTLRSGAGVTLTRGDIQYVVTEYGIAYLHGKNIRERAMDLISIAHPKFRQMLVEQAKELNLIYKDQDFIKGQGGEYPEAIETRRTTKAGVEIFLRPVKITDEHALKSFFYSLSQDCMYSRFISTRRDMPHERLQKFVIIDYTKEMVILAIVQDNNKEIIAGMGQYIIDDTNHIADVAFVVRDDYQNKGVGLELLSYLTYLAKRSGLHGFTAEVLLENTSMLHLFEKMGFVIDKHTEAGVYDLRMSFRE
ncbi:MAG: GNAT family N-acetyltransferase [Nitrospiraceae bacterium]|nr:GNAT family N-acetyltransferase [Nitrospiraceae bacterium]